MIKSKSTQPTDKSLKMEMSANRVFGIPMKQAKMKGKKKMSPEQVAKRKKSMISNAAGKVMGGLYSK